MKLIYNGISIEIIKANTFFKRFQGLMGKKNISKGMLFTKTSSIHTFFMKDNIDVIGLDENNKVIYKNENVGKNKIVIIKNNHKKTSVLELPPNTSHSIKIGDYLSFEGK